MENVLKHKSIHYIANQTSKFGTQLSCDFWKGFLSRCIVPKKNPLKLVNSTMLHLLCSNKKLSKHTINQGIICLICLCKTTKMHLCLIICAKRQINAHTVNCKCKQTYLRTYSVCAQPQPQPQLNSLILKHIKDVLISKNSKRIFFHG